jgi:hypothetical protein
MSGRRPPVFADHGSESGPGQGNLYAAQLRVTGSATGLASRVLNGRARYAKVGRPTKHLYTPHIRRVLGQGPKPRAP